MFFERLMHLRNRTCSDFRELRRAQKAVKTPQEASNRPPQECPEGPKSFNFIVLFDVLFVFWLFRLSDAPRRPKKPRTPLQDGQRGPQESPKTTQEGPKTAQEGPKTAQEAPKTPQEAPKAPQEAPKMPPFRSNRGSSNLGSSPRSSSLIAAWSTRIAT